MIKVLRVKGMRSLIAVLKIIIKEEMEAYIVNHDDGEPMFVVNKEEKVLIGGDLMLVCDCEL
jgi:nitrogen fixation protein